MQDAVTFFYIAAMIGGLWGIGRTIRCATGKHKDHIHVPGSDWVIAILGVFLPFYGFAGFAEAESIKMKYGDLMPYTVSDMPWINIILTMSVLIHVLFKVKSAGALMKSRDRLIEQMTPEQIVESTDKMIVDKSLVDDQWVAENWKGASTREWVERLAAKPTLVAETLSAKLKIAASTSTPFVEWLDLVKHFAYLEERQRTNSTVN